jgi:hypothetical protein
VKTYRFKSGISLNQIDYQSLMISVGSDIVLELSGLTTNQIKWIMAMNPLSTYHDQKLINLQAISPAFKRLMLKTFKSVRLMETYDENYPDYLQSENVNNVARVSSEFLDRDWHNVLKFRRTKTIALIGVSRFNLELIQLLIEIGFRKFQVQDDIVGSSSVGITFESQFVGAGLVESLAERFCHVRPKIDVRAYSERLPDLLMVSGTNSLEHVRPELLQKSGVANLFCLIEPLNSWISPVLPTEDLCCYGKFWDSLPNRINIALTKNSRAFGNESYYFGDPRQLKLLVALAGFRIADYFDRSAVSRPVISSNTKLWKINPNGEYELVPIPKGDRKCRSCLKSAELPPADLAEIKNF